MTDYFYGDKHKDTSYMKFPLFLLEDEAYQHLTAEAKLLYASMQRRCDLSRVKGWIDSQGRVFQYYTTAQVMQLLGCSKQKASNTYRELEKAGLLERQNQGQGKPSTVLLKRPVPSYKSDKPRSIYEDAVDFDSAFLESTFGTSRIL